MHQQNRFNLVDEPWIPIAGFGLASLSEIFSELDFKALGGNPVQKIALTKLLLAICQVAATPTDDEEWAEMGVSGMASKALAYLQEKKDCFWLYGEKPFLQMPELDALPIKIDSKDNGAKCRQIGNGDIPDLIADNNTHIYNKDLINMSEDSEKALFIVALQSFALAGKQCDDSSYFETGIFVKSPVAKVGPSMGRACFLHSFVELSSLKETLWINILTNEDLKTSGYWMNGIGDVFWEKMPSRPQCPIAINSMKSYLGTLVPMSRFVLFKNEALINFEGIQYPNHNDGWVEPTVSYRRTGKKIEVIQSSTEKKPWRSLTSLLSFLVAKDFDNLLLSTAINRIRNIFKVDTFKLWSGGLEADGDAFGQKIKSQNTYISSDIELAINYLGESWFVQVKNEMNELDSLSTRVYSSVFDYFKTLKSEPEGKKRGEAAGNLFWQLCETHFQGLVNACVKKEEVQKFRKQFAQIVNKCYSTYCPQDTARQLDAWAKNKPNVDWYLRGEDPKAKTVKPSKKSSSKNKDENSN